MVNTEDRLPASLTEHWEAIARCVRVYFDLVARRYSYIDTNVCWDEFLIFVGNNIETYERDDISRAELVDAYLARVAYRLGSPARS